MSLEASLASHNVFLYTSRPERRSSLAEASELVCININTLFSKMRITLKSTAYRLTALKGIIRLFESGRIAAVVDISTCGFRLTSLNEIV